MIASQDYLTIAEYLAFEKTSPITHSLCNLALA